MGVSEHTPVLRSNLHSFVQNFKIFQSLGDPEVNKAPVSDGKVGGQEL